ncbi:hypothetical protein [Streptomyces avermitilis]|uniref:hypothetical protein n=1 Tax=Streptomyces avermitilis TaxID=33903 RepID=UPI0033AAE54B
MVLILLVLLSTTFLLGWFGIEDLSEALTFMGRLTGAVLILVSATTLLSALAVVDHSFWNSFPYSGMVALIGTIAAFLTNAMLLFETVKSGDSVFYPVLLGLLMAGSAWAVFAVWRTSVVIPAPKRVAAAVVVSSVFAIANFGYQNLYQPYQRTARPLIKLTVGKPMLSQDRKAFAVPVDITLENHADVGFYVLGAEFHAMGEQVPLSSSDRLREQWRADAKRWSKFQEKNPLSRREIHQPGELVAAQPWMSPGFWIDASDAFATRTVVQLPMDTPYDQLAFYATASFARKDRIGLDSLSPQGNSWEVGQAPQGLKAKKKADFDSLIYRGRVRENNAIDQRTMDPRVITVYWKFGPQGAAVVPTITRRGEEGHTPSEAESRELVNRYGLVDAVTGPMERTLWDLKNQR